MVLLAVAVLSSLLVMVAANVAVVALLAIAGRASLRLVRISDLVGEVCKPKEADLDSMFARRCRHSRTCYDYLASSGMLIDSSSRRRCGSEV